MRFKIRTYIMEYGIVYASVKGLRYLYMQLVDWCTQLVIKPTIGVTGKGVLIKRGVVIELPHKVSMGDNCYIGPYTSFGSEFESGFAKLCNNVHIVGKCNIDMTGGIVIGDLTFISEQVMIYTHDHGYNPHSKPKPTPLKIGEKAWIGARSVILPGVQCIGDNAIIGVGAIVTKQVHENEIVAGNPARVVGHRLSF